VLGPDGRGRRGAPRLHPAQRQRRRLPGHLDARGAPPPGYPPNDPLVRAPSLANSRRQRPLKDWATRHTRRTGVTDINPPETDRVEAIDLNTEMQRSYIEYAMSVIVA